MDETTNKKELHADAQTLQGRPLAEGWDVNTKEQLENHRRIVGENTMRTRFPPEPNGHAHFGHGKSMYINFQEAFDRVQPADKPPLTKHVTFRYDDTNPEKEIEEYFESIAKSIEWLGWTPTQTTYTSDYFPQLYEFALRLIDEGKAYVCHQTGDEIEKSRNVCKALNSGVAPSDLPSPESPWRNTSPKENREKFLKMKKGYYKEGEASLRLKMDMYHRNPNMWDVVAYRIMYHPHYRTKNKWCIYPTYDYSHCVVDSLEHIDYSICTLEFENRRESYYWLLHQLGLYKPHVFEFSRLDLTNTVMSKRKLKKLVDEKQVRGWDDPRMPTLVGMRRRGFSRSMINAFMKEIGLTRNQAGKVEAHKFFSVVAKELDECAPRAFGILHPVELHLTDFSAENETAAFDAPVLPQDEASPLNQLGLRRLGLSRVLYVERDNVRASAEDASFYGLAPGKQVRLRYGPIVECTQVELDEAGGVRKVVGRLSQAAGKPKGVLHWLAEKDAVRCEVRLYDFLFKEGEGEDEQVNPESEVILRGCVVEKNLRELVRCGRNGYGEADPVKRCQLERVGFFCLDVVDCKPDGALVLNRIMPLATQVEAPPESEALKQYKEQKEAQKKAKVERMKFAPHEYFKRPGEGEKWAAFDADGVPTKAANSSEELSKAAVKKLRKEYEKHKDEYEEYHKKLTKA